MNAELRFFNTLLAIVGQMANSPNQQMAAVAAAEHAKLAARVAKMKRDAAEQTSAVSTLVAGGSLNAGGGL